MLNTQAFSGNAIGKLAGAIGVKKQLGKMGQKIAP
jgi:hypothetical protein